MKIGRKVGMPKREVVVGEEIDYLVWHSGTLAPSRDSVYLK